MDGQFKIRSYGYCELAMLYFPKSTKKSASNQLRRWIKINEDLKNQLKISGYKPGNKILTPKQVGIIISEIGLP